MKSRVGTTYAPYAAAMTVPRVCALLLALLLSVATAFAPPPTCYTRPASATLLEAKSAVVDEAEVLLQQAMQQAIQRMEVCTRTYVCIGGITSLSQVRVKDLTADIEAAQKVATENAIAARLDKIEEMISDIARKLN